MNWIPAWVPKWVISALPYLVVALVIAIGVWKYNHGVEKARTGGFNDGVTYQKGIEVQDTLRTRQEREDEKKRIEGQAAARVADANRDRAVAMSQLDGLHKELNRIREIGQRYTGPQSSGTSTGEIINMLADLYEASERDYNAAAAEADNYYNAGLTCEIQYDSLKAKHDKEKSSQAAN